MPLSLAKTDLCLGPSIKVVSGRWRHYWAPCSGLYGSVLAGRGVNLCSLLLGFVVVGMFCFLFPFPLLSPPTLWSTFRKKQSWLCWAQHCNRLWRYCDEKQHFSAYRVGCVREHSFFPVSLLLLWRCCPLSKQGVSHHVLSIHTRAWECSLDSITLLRNGLCSVFLTALSPVLGEYQLLLLFLSGLTLLLGISWKEDCWCQFYHPLIPSNGLRFASFHTIWSACFAVYISCVLFCSLFLCSYAADTV